MNNGKTTKQKSAKGCPPAENYRTIDIHGKIIKLDDFYYRRLLRDPDLTPQRKYTFIQGINITGKIVRIILKTVPSKSISLAKYIMRPGKGEIVDHINRDHLDNRRCNLRIVNARQNMLNRKLKNSTGFISVSTYNGKYGTYVRTNFTTKERKKLLFNCRDTPNNRILTAMAHDKFVLEQGEEQYAPLNFPCWKDEPFRSILLNEDLNKYKEGSKQRGREVRR
jgi:hypothetical protein